jgi:hypothetical protein
LPADASAADLKNPLIGRCNRRCVEGDFFAGSICVDAEPASVVDGLPGDLNFVAPEAPSEQPSVQPFSAYPRGLALPGTHEHRLEESRLLRRLFSADPPPGQPSSQPVESNSAFPGAFASPLPETSPVSSGTSDGGPSLTRPIVLVALEDAERMFEEQLEAVLPALEDRMHEIAIFEIDTVEFKRQAQYRACRGR